MNDYSEVFVGIREPFSKNSVWIYTGDVIEIRIF
jgi:translation initiation factor IF-1